MDYNPNLRPMVVADLTVSLPFRTATADVVIASSFLHIVPNPEAFLKEVWRVLKSDGLLLITAPLIFHYHPEPTDYRRFTEEGLRLLLQRSGFHEAEILPFGERFSSVAFLISPFLRPRWLIAPLVYWLCLKLDAVVPDFVAWVKKFRLPACPLGYVARAKKI